MKSIFTTTTTAVTRRPLAAFVLPMLLASAPMLRADDNDYVAHEWGTFTSIQGSGGVLLDWNAVATSDLPPFVYNWSRAGLQRFSSAKGLKSGLSSLQRMETPVIYFYAKKPLSLDVAVQFPKGQITEWFPQAAEVGPSFRMSGRGPDSLDNATVPVWNSAFGQFVVLTHPDHINAELQTQPPVTNSIIHWKNFEVLPAKQHSDLANRLPTDAKASHYFAARTEDASFVRVNSLEQTNPAPEIEKFLFYRGVGNFPTPLNVTMNEQGTITVTNSGKEPLKHLFAVAINGNRATVMPLGNLDSGQSRQTRVDNPADNKPASSAVKTLRQQMSDALVAEGLYRSEADAMVETWRDAWFEDQGVRLLYILPRAWTDTTLPITLMPHPRELVRVMVGRAEVITPTMERQIVRCVEEFRQSDPAAKQAAVSEFRAMKLGRFGPVALQLAASHAKDAKFFEDGMDLIHAAAQPARATATSAPQAARRLPATGG